MITYWLDRQTGTYYAPWGWCGHLKELIWQQHKIKARVRLDSFRPIVCMPYILFV